MPLTLIENQLRLTPLQNELLMTLNAYLADRSSLDDVRAWEVSVTDSADIRPAEAQMIERLALIAETVIRGAMDEEAFADEARRLVNRLEAEASPRATAGTRPPEARVETVTLDVQVILTSTEQVSRRFLYADSLPVAVSV